MKTHHIRSLAAVALLFTASCSAIPHVKELKIPILNSSFAGQLINPDKFTEQTQQLLEQEDLIHDYYKNPADVVIALRQILNERPTTQVKLALVEVCSNAGEGISSTKPREAVGYYLAAAELVLQGAMRNSDDKSKEHLLEIYNFSCGRVAQILFEYEHNWDEVVEVKGPERTYRLRSLTVGDGLISPAFFDEFWLAKNLEFEGINNMDRTIRPGFGGMMVGHREYKEERTAKEPLLSRAGMSLPVTVTIDAVDDNGLMELAFHDVMTADKTRLRKQSVPLAADLTAPLAMLYNYAPKGNIGTQGLLHPDRYAKRMGLIQFEPFRKNEIPIIFVHGLASSPATWMTAVNTLRSDPELRKKYQLLAFYYPTGFPIAYNADGLREHLQKFHDFYSSGKNSNPHLNNMLIIGHSMGGDYKQWANSQ